MKSADLLLVAALGSVSILNPLVPLSHVTLSTCPPEVPLSRPLMVNWITNPNLSDLRTSTGTTGLDTTQIALLVAPHDTTACGTLDAKFPIARSATIGANNDRRYDLTYYKVGNFYFVTIVTAPASDPNIVRIGYQMIYIFDASFNYIAGYSG